MINRRGIYTLFKKEMRRVAEVWKQTVIAPVITNLLFLVIFGVALSARTSPTDGLGYLTLLIPGLVAMAIMMNSFQNPMSSLMIAKYTNNIGDLLMLPMRGIEIAFAYISAGVIRGFIVGIVTLIVGMFFAPVIFTHPLVIIMFAIMLGMIFSSFGTIIGVVSKDFDKASIIPTFIITPLMYLSGVFYPVSSLPGIFSKVSMVNPIFYLVDGLKFGFLGTSDVSIWVSLPVTFAITVVMFGVASWMFQIGYKMKT